MQRKARRQPRRNASLYKVVDNVSVLSGDIQTVPGTNS